MPGLYSRGRKDGRGPFSTRSTDFCIITLDDVDVGVLGRLDQPGDFEDCGGNASGIR